MTKVPTSEIWISAAECAERTGLTTRALRLYELQGLIQPRRTEKSWRLYGSQEIEKLNAIITLKSYGLPLARISELLSGRDSDVESILVLQHAALRRAKESADRGLLLVENALKAIASGARPDTTHLLQIAREISMTQMTADSVAWKRYEQARPRTAVAMNTDELRQYAGFYEMDQGGIIEIRVENGGLVAQSLANTALEILPEANDKFFYKAFAAQCTFVRGADGEIAGLVVHEDGFEKPGRRIPEASARELQARLKARIETKQPFEGSRQILGKLISEAQSGEVDWTTKSEEFRLISEPQVAGIKAWMVKLGELRSIVFSGVNASGWDIYHVSFANGLLEWSFFLDRNGKLRGEWMRDLPSA